MYNAHIAALIALGILAVGAYCIIRHTRLREAARLKQRQSDPYPELRFAWVFFVGGAEVKYFIPKDAEEQFFNAVFGWNSHGRYVESLMIGCAVSVRDEVFPLWSDTREWLLFEPNRFPCLNWEPCTGMWIFHGAYPIFRLLDELGFNALQDGSYEALAKLVGIPVDVAMTCVRDFDCVIGPELTEKLNALSDLAGYINSYASSTFTFLALGLPIAGLGNARPVDLAETPDGRERLKAYGKELCKVYHRFLNTPPPCEQETRIMTWKD